MPSFPSRLEEIEATVLFSDITGFSRRTLDLTATETLVFVNNFLAWISAEALRGRPGIVDKYIGDAIMVVFSTEFGSKEPFVDAIQTARWMMENDVHDFDPHIGIASGPVIVGYVGTPLKYDCSVFGHPVAMAARCAGVKPNYPEGTVRPPTIVFPASEWGDRSFTEVIDSAKWELCPPRTVAMKNLPETEIREIQKMGFWVPFDYSATDRARDGLQAIRDAGRYWPR